MYFYQQGGMPPEEMEEMEEQSNPEEQIAMQIMEAFQQLSPEMQTQLLEAMAQMVQQGQQQQASMQQEGIPMQKYGGRKKGNPYK